MSTAEKRYRHYSRTFLNLPGEHGLAAALITVSRNPCDGAGFTLSDCNRVVSLDLSMYDEEAIENSLFKAETPYAEIRELRKQVRAQAKRARKRLVELKKRGSDPHSDPYTALEELEVLVP